MRTNKIQRIKQWQRLSLSLIYFQSFNLKQGGKLIQNVFNELQKKQVNVGITFQEVQSWLILNQNIQLKILINLLFPQVKYSEAIRISGAYHQKKIKQIFSQQNIKRLLQKTKQLCVLSSVNNPIKYKKILDNLANPIPRSTQIGLITQNSLIQTKSKESKYLSNKILYLQENLLLPGCDLIVICEKLIVPKYIKNITINLSGKNAQNYPNTNAVQGQKAKQGRPGQHSGRLLIICLQYFSNFKVNYIGQGGNGGNGQNAYYSYIQNYIGPKLHYQNGYLHIDSNTPASQIDYRFKLIENKDQIEKFIKLNQNRSIKKYKKIHHFDHIDILYHIGMSKIQNAKKFCSEIANILFFTKNIHQNQNTTLEFSKIKNPRIFFVNADDNFIYQNGVGGLPGNQGQIITLSKTENLKSKFNIDIKKGNTGQPGHTHIKQTHYKSHALVQQYLVQNDGNKITQYFGFVQVDKIYDGNKFVQIKPIKYLQQAQPQKNRKLFEKEVLFSFLDQQLLRLKDKSQKYDIELLKIILQQVYLFEFPTQYDEKNHQQSIYGFSEKMSRVILHQNITLKEALYIHPYFQKLSSLNYVKEKNDLKIFVNQTIRLKSSARNIIILNLQEYCRRKVSKQIIAQEKLKQHNQIDNKRKQNLKLLTSQVTLINQALLKNSNEFQKNIQEYKQKCGKKIEIMKNQIKKKFDEDLQNNQKNKELIKKHIIFNSIFAVLKIGFSALCLTGEPISMTIGTIGSGIIRAIDSSIDQSQIKINFDKSKIPATFMDYYQQKQKIEEFKQRHNQINQNILNLTNQYQLFQEKKNYKKLLQEESEYSAKKQSETLQLIKDSGKELYNIFMEGKAKIKQNQELHQQLLKMKKITQVNIQGFISELDNIIRTLLGLRDQLHNLNKQQVYARYIIALGYLKNIFLNFKNISKKLTEQINQINDVYKSITKKEQLDLLKQTDIFLFMIQNDFEYIQKLENRLRHIQDLRMLVSFINYEGKTETKISKLQQVLHQHTLSQIYRNVIINLVRRMFPNKLDKFSISNSSNLIQNLQNLQTSISNYLSSYINHQHELKSMKGWIPLYDWKQKSYRNQFKNIFTGKNVILYTKPQYVDQISAVKLLKMPCAILYVQNHYYQKIKNIQIKVFLKLNLQKNLYNVKKDLFVFNLNEKQEQDGSDYLSYKSQQIDLIIQPIENYKKMITNQNKLNLSFSDILKNKLNSFDQDEQLKLNSKQYSPYGQWNLKLTVKKKQSDQIKTMLQQSIIQLYGYCQYINNTQFDSQYNIDIHYINHKYTKENQKLDQLKIIEQQQQNQQQIIEQQQLFKDKLVTIACSFNYQLWTINRSQDIALQNQKQSGKKVQLSQNKHIKNQKFRLVHIKQDTYKIFTCNTNKCLDVFCGLDINFTPVIQWENNSGLNQLWALQSTGKPSQYFIRSQKSKKYIEVGPTGIYINSLTKNQNQRWILEFLPEIALYENQKIVFKSSANQTKLLTSGFTQNVLDHKNINIVTTHNFNNFIYQNQTFIIRSTGQDRYSILNFTNNKICLDIYKEGNTKQTPIISTNYKGGSNQQWIFHPTGKKSQFYIQEFSSGKYIQVQKSQENSIVQLKNLNKENHAQKWIIDDSGLSLTQFHSVRFHNMDCNKVLQMSTTGLIVNNLQTYNYNQLFNIKYVKNNIYKIIRFNTSQCFSAFNNLTAHQTPVIQQPIKQSENQQWIFQSTGNFSEFYIKGVQSGRYLGVKQKQQKGPAIGNIWNLGNMFNKNVQQIGGALGFGMGKPQVVVQTNAKILDYNINFGQRWQIKVLSQLDVLIQIPSYTRIRSLINNKLLTSRSNLQLLNGVSIKRLELNNSQLGLLQKYRILKFENKYIIKESDGNNVLTILNDGMDDRTPIVSLQNHSTQNQYWIFQSAGAPSQCFIRSISSGKYIQANQSGEIYIMESNKSSKNQRWCMDLLPVVSLFQNKVVIIANSQVDNQVITVNKDNTLMIQYRELGNNTELKIAQRFRILSGMKSHRIVTQDGSKYLDACGKDEKMQIITNSINNSSNIQWIFEPVGGNYSQFYIKSFGTAQYIGLLHNKVMNNDKLKMQKYNPGARWKIIVVQ